MLTGPALLALHCLLDNPPGNCSVFLLSAFSLIKSPLKRNNLVLIQESEMDDTLKGGGLLSLLFFSLRLTIPSILTALHLCMQCVLGRECALLLKDICVHGRGRNWVGSGVGIEAGK